MKYTNLENLARRLRGRLQIANQPLVDTNIGALAGYGQTVGAKTIDNDTIEMVVNQKESYIDLILSQIYVTPLALSSEITVNILSDITECLAISSLIQIHFEGTNPIVPAADASGAAIDLRRHAEYLLASITASSGIFIPVSPSPSPNAIGVPQIQPLRLPGEVLLGTNEIPDIITKNISLSAQKNIKREHFVEPSIYGAREDGQARGTSWLENS